MLAHQEWACQRHRDDGIPLRLGVENGLVVSDRGVADQDIDASSARHDGGDLDLGAFRRLRNLLADMRPAPATIAT
jgi:hypothetical protein